MDCATALKKIKLFVYPKKFSIIPEVEPSYRLVLPFIDIILMSICISTTVTAYM